MDAISEYKRYKTELRRLAKAEEHTIANTRARYIAKREALEAGLSDAARRIRDAAEADPSMVPRKP